MSLSSLDSSPLETSDQDLLNKLPNGFKIHHYFQRYLTTEYAFAGGLMINLVLTINYVFFRLISQSQLKMQNSQSKQWFLKAGFYFTLFCILLLVSKIHAQYHYQTQSQRVSVKKTIYTLILKTTILLLRPYPFLETNEPTEIYHDTRVVLQNQYHPYNNILAVLGLSQTFMLLETVFNTSKFKNDRSSRICDMYGIRASNMYVIRVWFKRNYILKVISIFFVCTLVYSESVRIAEYRYNHHFRSFENSFWFTVTTIFCLGYGDIVPQTNFGNWIASFIMYTGLIFTCYLITEIHIFLSLNSHERRALTLSNTLEKKTQVKIAAKKFIRASLCRVWKNYKNREYGVQFPPNLEQIRLKKELKELRMQAKNFRGVQTVHDQFLHNFERTQGYIESLMFNNRQLQKGLLESLKGNKITQIMSRRGLFTDRSINYFEDFEIETIENVKTIEPFQQIRSFDEEE